MTSNIEYPFYSGAGHFAWVVGKFDWVTEADSGKHKA